MNNQEETSQFVIITMRGSDKNQVIEVAQVVDCYGWGGGRVNVSKSVHAWRLFFFFLSLSLAAYVAVVTE